jgi:methylation protein EvaC
MRNCLICETELEPVISYGDMPLANGFLTPDQYDKEFSFELAIAVCPKCYMVQLLDQPNADQMFHENYAFFSGTSSYMQKHFAGFAKQVQEKYLTGDDPFIVEIGSNDGIMLQNFAKANIRHLGIEPSKNVAQVAIDKGINTITEFFNEDCAKLIVKKHGQADAFVAANVMCHIPPIHTIVKGIKTLLKPSGIAQFEDPYLGDVLEKVSYDQIYDEHTFLFSANSIDFLFGMYDMELINVEHQITHGGSMRYTLAHKGAHAINESVAKQKQKESDLGIRELSTYADFRRNCETSKEALKSLLEDLKKQGKRVVGYGATSKSTTVLNYCGITPDLIEYMTDTTPIKQGKFTPGAHIPVIAPDTFHSDYPDYAVLFAWNHITEIMEKETAFVNGGGKWIVFVPQVKVLR